MATTYFQWTSYIQDNIDLYETSGTYDTPEFGEPVWLSGGEARTVTDVDAPQMVVGLSYTRPATAVQQYDYPDDKIAIALFPLIIVTDNVDSTNPPEAGKEVYILDNGSFSDEDGGSANVRYGYCTRISSGMYSLALTGPTIDST